MTRHATSTIHDVSSLKNRDAEKLGGSEDRKKTCRMYWMQR